MLNKSEYNNTVICVVPMEEMHRTSIRCNNGVICIKGARDKCLELMKWLEMFGVKTFSRKHEDYNITLDESGIFHIFGDENDGNYYYIQGDFGHKTPYKNIGLVEVEPFEDGGRVWRDFRDFDVEVTFNLA